MTGTTIEREIVALLLGPRWGAAVVPLQLLPLVMPITMLSPFLNTAFQGIGRSGVVFMNVFTAFLVMPAAFWIGTRWQLLGVSMAWIIGFPLVFLVNLQRMLPLVGLSLPCVLMALAPPALAAAGMYACVVIARHFLSASMSAPLLMAALVAAGAAGYAISTLAANRSGAREMMDLVRNRQSDDRLV